MSRYKEGEVIFRQGDDATALFIVKSGEVEVIKDGNPLGIVPAGSYFGENALLEASKAKRSASIIAKNEVLVLSVDRQLLMDIYGKDVSSICLNNKIRNMLEASEVFKLFTRTQNERIINHLIVHYAEEHQVIIEQGKQYEHIVLIVEGEVCEEVDVLLA